MAGVESAGEVLADGGEYSDSRKKGSELGGERRSLEILKRGRVN